MSDDVEAELRVTIDAHSQGAASRSGLYRLLGEVFAYPKGELLNALASGELHYAATTSSSGLPYAFTPVAFVGSVDAEHDFAVAYTTLFDVAAGSPKVPIVERRYVQNGGSEHPIWEDLLRFYGHFGIRLEDGLGEDPDHLRVELEFMHYLTFLEAGAPEDQVRSLQRAEHDFLERHLAKWIGEFRDRVCSSDETLTYGTLAQMLALYVAADLAYLKSRVDDAE